MEDASAKIDEACRVINELRGHSDAMAQAIGAIIVNEPGPEEGRKLLDNAMMVDLAARPQARLANSLLCDVRDILGEDDENVHVLVAVLRPLLITLDITSQALNKLDSQYTGTASTDLIN